MKIKHALAELREIQFVFTKQNDERKLALLQQLDNAQFDSIEDLITYHDRLLCMLAYPANRTQFEAAEKSLRKLSEKLNEAQEKAKDKDFWKLTQSAVPYSTLNASFSYEMVKWLLRNFGEAISFSSCDVAKELVGFVFKQVLPPAVGEALFDNHEHSLASLARKATGVNKEPDLLRWTVTQFDSAPLSDKTREQLFEMLQIYVRWETNASIPSRTFSRAPAGKKYFFNDKALVHHVDIKKIFRDKKIHQHKLSSAEKQSLCDIAKGVLCTNYREIDPITYSEPADTEFYDMGRGITIALYFMRPSWRLSCETYASYMAFRNDVPVSYGGGWMFFDRAKLAGNIFSPFRGGESAYLFAQLYRLYSLRFGVHCFQVDPYQIGEKNEDAIKSGAFWFYYKMGFRPTDKHLIALANEETGKIVADRKYRSPASVLRRFTHGEMVLNLKPAVHISHQQLLVQMEKLVTKKYGGDFAAYFNESFQLLEKACRKNKVSINAALRKHPLSSELCGLLALTTDFSKWNKTDLKKLVAAMEEKVWGSDRKFLGIFNGITALRRSIANAN